MSDVCRFEKSGSCPNCGLPIFIKNKGYYHFGKDGKSKPPTIDDLVILCPCIKILHANAKAGMLRGN